jgi:hypothetical protein
LPASARPYIGGSTTNSVLELTLGYNGLGRIFGGEGGRPGGGQAGEAMLPGGGPTGEAMMRGGGGGPGGGFGGATGITRMFGSTFGTEISWLLPAALIALVAGLWLTRRAPRTDRTRAALLLWGGWLLVTGLVFSYMQGIIHPYYAIALAPPIAALVAVTGWELWRQRASVACRSILAVMLAATGVWVFVLLNRTPTWYPALRYAIVFVAVLAAAGLVVGAQVARRAAVVGAVAAVLAGVAGPAAYAVETAATPHSGAIPTAGPAGGPGSGSRPNDIAGGQPGASGPFGITKGRPGGPGGTGGPGGPGGDRAVDAAVTSLLKATTSRWAAATMGSQSAAPLQLASGRAVMAIGGFSGGDPAPTLAQFQRYVAGGEVRYFIAGGRGGGFGGGPGGRDGGGEIASWVQSHFTATTVGGQTVYDLSTPVTAG